jgi:hypothetical protein
LCSTQDPRRHFFACFSGSWSEPYFVREKKLPYISIYTKRMQRFYSVGCWGGERGIGEGPAAAKEGVMAGLAQDKPGHDGTLKGTAHGDRLISFFHASARVVPKIGLLPRYALELRPSPHPWTQERLEARQPRLMQSN